MALLWENGEQRTLGGKRRRFDEPKSRCKWRTAIGSNWPKAGWNPFAASRLFKIPEFPREGMEFLENLQNVTVLRALRVEPQIQTWRQKGFVPRPLSP
jgi:hypothetical protein